MRQVDQINNLTEEQLEDKIKQVDSDIKKMQAEGDGGRKVDILIEYQNYLKDELKSLKSNNG
jgi:hypothetical protein